MPTAIPPTVFTQITQTNFFPEIIAYLLNEAEATYSTRRRTWNATRLYPFWKTCLVCSMPYPCTDEGEVRNRVICSHHCQGKYYRQQRAQSTEPLRPHGNTKYVLPCVKSCVRCGKSFTCHTRYQAVRNTLCSASCRAAALSEARKGKRKKPPRMAVCRQCGKEFELKNGVKSAVYCSKSCNGRVRALTVKQHSGNMKGRKRRDPRYGAANPAWKGGVTYFRKHGNYAHIKYVRCPAAYLAMARKDGYVMEHRLLVAQAMGRILLRTEVVHHIDHDPTNNALSNLLLFASNQDHKLYEGRGSPAPIWSLSSPSSMTVLSGASA